jgi:hypothetical protein
MVEAVFVVIGLVTALIVGEIRARLVSRILSRAAVPVYRVLGIAAPGGRRAKESRGMAGSLFDVMEGDKSEAARRRKPTRVARP